MLELFLGYILVYKYVVLFLVVLTASIGFPIPATTLIIAAGAFAAQEYLDIRIIMACSFIASVLGDNIGYYISYHYGKNILISIGLKSLIGGEKYKSVERMFSHHSISVIFLSRFVLTALGPTVNILSGLSKTPYKKFFFFDFAGELLYAIIFSGLGYIFVEQWEAISSISGDVTALLSLLFILLALTVWIFFRKKYKKG